MKKIILYIATSIDGFIADLSGGVDWLPPPESDPDDSCGYKSFIENISIIIMGSTSYNQILSFGEWAWPAKQTYVFTSQNLTAIETSISFVNEPPKKFVAKLKRSGADKDIWLRTPSNEADDSWLRGGKERLVFFNSPLPSNQEDKIEHSAIQSNLFKRIEK